MDHDRVVVRPVGRLDSDSIETLLGLLACAREAGLIAVVDLDAVESDDPAVSDVLAHIVTDRSARTSSPS